MINYLNLDVAWSQYLDFYVEIIFENNVNALN